MESHTALHVPETLPREADVVGESPISDYLDIGTGMFGRLLELLADRTERGMGMICRRKCSQSPELTWKGSNA